MVNLFDGNEERVLTIQKQMIDIQLVFCYASVIESNQPREQFENISRRGICLLKNYNVLVYDLFQFFYCDFL